MTDVGRMSVGELVGKVLADEHADVLGDAVCWLAQELMEAEVSQRAGAGYGSVTPTGWRAATAIGSGPGTPGWVDRAGHPQAAVRLLLPELLGAAPPLRAGAGRGGAGGLCQRDLDP
jgi:hypothetical protein